MSSTFDQIANIIAETCDIPRDTIKPESHAIDDLGIDSLGLVESIFAIEEAFDISIPFNANEPEKSEFDISNMGTIMAAVERLVAAVAAVIAHLAARTGAGLDNGPHHTPGA